MRRIIIILYDRIKDNKIQEKNEDFINRRRFDGY